MRTRTGLVIAFCVAFFLTSGNLWAEENEKSKLPPAPPSAPEIPKPEEFKGTISVKEDGTVLLKAEDSTEYVLTVMEPPFGKPENFPEDKDAKSKKKDKKFPKKTKDNKVKTKDKPKGGNPPKLPGFDGKGPEFLTKEKLQSYAGKEVVVKAAGNKREKNVLVVFEISE